MCLLCDCNGDFSWLQHCTELTFRNCPNLVEIPSFEFLQELVCCNCPKLTTIHPSPRLLHLACCHSPALKSLPNLPLLQDLECSYCRCLTHLPSYPLILSRYIIGSVWIEPSLTQMESLKRLQRWWRRKYWKRRMFQHIWLNKHFKGCQDLVSLIETF